MDDDDESVKLTFGTLPDRVSEGTQDETTVSIGDDDDPYVEVEFGAATYSADEGGTVSVTVTLSADPERTFTILLIKTEQGGVSSADYSGVPTSVTFNAGETSKTFTFSAAQDEVDDDDEGVKVTFETLPDRVSEGTQDETTVSIDDDDNPHVTVQFTQDEYTVVEGSNVGVRVRLSADPERTVSIPITATNQEGATSADYTVPSSVTFDAGETEKAFTFAAADDDEDDFGESVKLSFGATLPDRITRSGLEETTINIWQFTALDCSVALLCVDVNFADRTALDWAWNELIYKANWDPASSISDDDFEFGGLEYTIHRIRIIPGVYPEMDNTWSRSFQHEAELQISIARGPERSAPSPDHYRDWTLYIDDVTLPLSQALQNWHEFRWYGAGIQNLFADWTPSTTNRIGIMRTPFADQPQAVVPGVPRLVDADSVRQQRDLRALVAAAHRRRLGDHRLQGPVERGRGQLDGCRRRIRESRGQSKRSGRKSDGDRPDRRNAVHAQGHCDQRGGGQPTLGRDGREAAGERAQGGRVGRQRQLADPALRRVHEHRLRARDQLLRRDGQRWNTPGRLGHHSRPRGEADPFLRRIGSRRGDVALPGARRDPTASALRDTDGNYAPTGDDLPSRRRPTKRRARRYSR